jgi:molybdopterin/thiamine biosynthesis adenylyltransferase
MLFCRTIGMLTQAQLDLLAHKTVAVGGAGGVGFTHAECLVRQGIGQIKISDLDTFGPENMNRQFGCTINTIGRDKAEVLEERLMSINPSLRVDRFGAVDNATVGNFLDGVDFVCDGMDYFAVGAHRMLHAEARARGIPAIICGPNARGVTIHLFDPAQMSFDEYFDLHDGMDELDMLQNWGTGLGPSHRYRYYMDDPKLDPRQRRATTVSSVCLLASAVLGANVLRKLIIEPIGLKPVPYVYHLDLVTLSFDEIHIPGGVRAIKAEPERYYR